MGEIAFLILWWLSLLSFLSIVFCVVSVTAFYIWHGNLTVSRSYDNVPKVRLIPIVSYWQALSAMNRRKYPRAFLLQLMAAFCKMISDKKISMFWLGFRPIVFFFKPEAVEILLNNSVTITKSAEYDFLKFWLGTGLLTSSGKKWRSHRKLLTPAFHFQILQDFLLTFNEQASILTKKLECSVKEPWIDVVGPITMCTLDTICQTAMGVQLNTQTGCCMDYFDGLNKISDVFIYRILRPWLWFDPIFLYLTPSGWNFRRTVNRIHDFTRKVIKTKKEFFIKQGIGAAEKADECTKPRRKVFLELLLEHHLKDETFTEENIREEVDTFMFEGHDTTAMSICWTLYELGRNPKVQQAVFEEIDSVFQGDRDRDVLVEDLKQMKYLECTVKESLRLNPSVAFIARQLNEDLKIDEYTLKPGSTCLLTIFTLHMDPKQFPEPDLFDPDRFLPENSSQRHPYAYVPFSAGPRNCIGQRFAMMELKTVLVHILRKFKVSALDPRDRIEKMAGLILKNAEPIRIKFELRDREYEPPS